MQQAVIDNPVWLPADWPAPTCVRAGSTTSLSDISPDSSMDFNLAMHTGDNPGRVSANRSYLQNMLNLPAAPIWLRQVHGSRIITAGKDATGDEADGCYSDQRGHVCAVLTADCIPLMLCNREGSEIAAVHAGWRGLCNGVIENALGCFRSTPTEILAWVGPHICSRHYEVGSEVLNRCKEVYGAKAHTAFIATRPDHWQADLGKLAEMALSGCGITAMYSSGHCTFARTDLLYSYRRNREGGRFASLIWITPD
ncbi:MAG: hypothetical protein A3I78_08870 [Gammaproteobacteria bacterium RIFCSPLOWO2_02_FULL_56_15]|nr:MAG: hypothetical protein A3I78_08870 [Gammaproteobacteria bacterium RIFCSPLOWO2_02_FULL_56_15]